MDEYEIIPFESEETFALTEIITVEQIDDSVVVDVVQNCFYISIPVFLSIIVTIIVTRVLKYSLSFGKKV